MNPNGSADRLASGNGYGDDDYHRSGNFAYMMQENHVLIGHNVLAPGVLMFQKKIKVNGIRNEEYDRGEDKRYTTFEILLSGFTGFWPASWRFRFWRIS